MKFNILSLAVAAAFAFAAPALAVDAYQTPFQAVAVSNVNTAKDCGGPAAQITVNNTGTKDLFAFPGSATAVATTSNGIPVRVCQGVRINFGTQTSQMPLGIGLITGASDTTTADVLCTYTQPNLGRTENIYYYPIPGCASTNNSTTTGVLTANNEQGNFQTFALTSGAAAATFVKVAIPSNSWANLLVEYVFEASSATPNVQAFGGLIGVNAVNVAGTITCTVGVVTTATQPALAANTGTLTNAITCADATGGVLNVLATDTSSITPTTNRIRYRVRALSPGSPLVITPQ